MDVKEVLNEIQQYRKEKEIVRKYEDLILESGKMVDSLNDNWDEKNKLRSEYQTLTGKDIAKRHKTR